MCYFDTEIEADINKKQKKNTKERSYLTKIKK